MNDEYNEWEDRACRVFLEAEAMLNEFYAQDEANEKRSALQKLLENPFQQVEPVI